jgi:hypothetical protein
MDFTDLTIQSAIHRIFAPLLFIVGGGAVLVVGLRELHSIREASRWPSTEGTVESSEVKSEIRETREDNRTRRRREYFAEVVYQFEVDGRSYRGQRLRFASVVSDSPAAAERDVAAHPVGSSVRVYYDPAQPEESVLDRSFATSSFLLPSFGLVLLVFGLTLGYLFNR